MKFVATVLMPSNKTRDNEGRRVKNCLKIEWRHLWTTPTGLKLSPYFNSFGRETLKKTFLYKWFFKVEYYTGYAFLLKVFLTF